MRQQRLFGSHIWLLDLKEVELSPTGSCFCQHLSPCRTCVVSYRTRCHASIMGSFHPKHGDNTTKTGLLEMENVPCPFRTKPIMVLHNFLTFVAISNVCQPTHLVLLSIETSSISSLLTVPSLFCLQYVL